MITYKLEFTLSKVLAYLLVIFSGIALMFKTIDGANFAIVTGLAVGLMANKQFQDRKKTEIHEEPTA